MCLCVESFECVIIKCWTKQNVVMILDKSWTRLESRCSREFFWWSCRFIEHCKPLLNSYGNIKCPCRNCCNVPCVSLDKLKRHISQNGWDPTYTQWRDHGEPYPLPIEHNTTQCEMSDMGVCLNDILDIPLNNKQNEPTPPNIGETSNEPTQATTPPVRNEFEELLASSN